MATARLKRSVVAWTASIVVHLVLALILLTVGVNHIQSESAKTPPVSRVVEAVEELELAEPMTDLQVDAPAVAPLEAAVDAAALSAEEPVGDYGDAIAAVDEGAVGYTAVGPAGPISHVSRFCGASGSAAHVAFVVDHSGSMVMAHDYVKRQLCSSIAELTPGHYFNIVYYAAGEPLLFAPGQLVRATGAQREAAVAFVEGVGLDSVGSAQQAWKSVAGALERAFGLRSLRGVGPQLIYLLTDGEYDHHEITRCLRRLQGQRGGSAVTVNVIACGSRDSEPFLKKLAEDHGGGYRFVTDEELARP